LIRRPEQLNLLFEREKKKLVESDLLVTEMAGGETRLQTTTNCSANFGLTDTRDKAS
jgi:hypothetical protein